jgi:hypothetical protein
MKSVLLLLSAVLIPTIRAQEITLVPDGFPLVALATSLAPGELMMPQTSSNLEDWIPQSPVAVGADGMLRFTDYGGRAQPRRFYRAATLPGPGSWIYYERRNPVSATSIIYRCRLDGSQEAGVVVGRYPRVSPDGRWILLTRNGTGPLGHEAADIYAYDVSTIPGANNPRLIYDNGTSYSIVNYGFRRDNFRIGFDYGSGVDGRLYTTTLNGGQPAALFPSGDCQEAMPSFSPDDSQVVFAHRIPSQLATRRAGEAKRILTSPGLGDSWPQWSPNGTWIAACDGNTNYTRTDLGHDLLLIDPASGIRTALTQVTEPEDGFPYGGAWSANSLWLYAAGTVGGLSGVWRVPVTGGDPQAVTITSPFDIAPGISTAPVVFVGGIVP